MKTSSFYRQAAIGLLLFGVLTVGKLHAQVAATDFCQQLKVGSNIPAFSKIDQFGKLQDFESLKSANGLVLLFFRSVDW